MKKLPSERNNPSVAQRIRGEFARQFHHRGSTFFEHGHWWIERTETGAVWSVYDTGSGFGFEQVSGPEE